MKSYLFIFILSLCLSDIIKITHPVNKSKVTIAADDYLLNFSINGKSVDLTGRTDLRNWSTLKTFSVYLKEGDVISIQGMNKSTNLYDLRGMAVSIEFNEGNDMKIYSSGDGWTCDGKPAIIKSKLNAPSNRWSIWNKFFTLDTWVIWGPITNVKSTCEFTIPSTK